MQTLTAPAAPARAMRQARKLRRFKTPEFEVAQVGYELRLTALEGEPTVRRFLLERRHADLYGWQELHRDGSSTRITVIGLVDLLLRDLDAEDLVYELTEQALTEMHALRGASEGAERSKYSRSVDRLQGELRSAQGRKQLPVARLQRRFLELEGAGEVTAALICQKLGWLADDREDTTRLKRRLGLKSQTDRRTGQPVYSTHVHYDVAVRLARALDLAPADIGA